MTSPHVSVIVPVRDRRDEVVDLLNALAQQSYRDFELIVVDDGSTDDSAALAEAESRFAVRVLRQQGAGAVAARTAGVALSDAPVLAFTDSDCIPSPDWLAAGVAHIDADFDVAMGHTHAIRPRRLLERSLHVEDNGLYPTCNVFYSRAAFDAAGGFDAALGKRIGFSIGRRAKHLGVGEDTVLGWRVRRAGAAAYVPEAEVGHAVFPFDLKDHLSRTLQAGAFPGLVKQVPELRKSMLTAKVFLGTTRIPFYAFVLLFFVLPLQAIVLLFWFLAFHALRVAKRPDSLKRRLLAYPVVVATDVLTAGALVVGSIRSLSLVL